MPQLFEDQVLPNQSGSDSTLFAPPSSGIGITPQPIVPAVSGAPMSGMDKLGLTLQETGAGLTGGPSPIDARMRQAREQRADQMREFKASTEALTVGMGLLEGLEGEARTKFAKSHAAQLERVFPGMGGLFEAAANRPEIATEFKNYSQYLPESIKLAMQSNPRQFRKWAGTSDGIKTLTEAENKHHVKIALHKAKGAQLAADQFVPPEKITEYGKDGKLAYSELMDMQQYLPTKLRLTEREVEAITGDPEKFSLGAGLIDPKTEAEIFRKKQGEKEKPVDYNKPFLPDGTPNLAYQEYATKKAKSGAANVSTVIKENDKKFEKENKLRDDYTANPKVKASAEMDSAFKMIEAAYKNPTAANDLAMATKYMKILDPTSVVRESEFALAVNATGLLDKVQNYAASVLQGKKLNPNQRKDFYDSAKAINDSFQAGRADVDKEYAEMATGYGLDPKNVIPSLRTRRSTDKTSQYIETRKTADGKVLGKKADGTIEEIK